MKTIFKIGVIVLLAAFYGCQNDGLTSMNSSITSDGVFSGIIVNDSNRIDSIKVYSENVIGKGNVSSDGKFSFVLTPPVLSKIGTVPGGVVVSDTTAMVGSVYEFEAFKGGINNGNINKSNFIYGSIVKAGLSAVQFMYSDRTFTIKGTETHLDSYNNISTNITVKWSLAFKKGWNEIVMKIDSYSTTATTSAAVETYSNTITSDLQWRYSPSNAYYVHAKTRGVLGVVRQGFLFR